MSENFIKCLSGMTWVLQGHVNIGIVESTDGVYLIDSGNDQDAGKKMMKVLGGKGWNLKAVINTHSNADHIGANSYLQRSTGCEIWAPEIESAFITYPKLEPSFLWGGYPFKELRSKFFEAKPSKVNHIINENTMLPGFSFIPLPGHFFGQTGVLVDDVFFLGDSLFGKNIIEKYGLPFIYDVRAYRISIEKIKAIEAEYYVPSHGEIVSDVSELADSNLEMINDAVREIFSIIRQECTFEELLKTFCDSRKIKLDYGQYVLVGSTIKSFLSYLYNRDKAAYTFKDNQMFWKAK